MAVDPKVRQARGIFIGTYGVTVTAGDLMYFDGTNWLKADADDNTKFAEAIATNSFSSGDIATLCTSCIIVDDDAPYTQGDTQYLSTTAGELTTTRPTGSNALAQVVGYALSTKELMMVIDIPREVSIWVDLPYAGGTAAVTVDGDWAGLSMLADNDAAHGVGVFPNNAVGLKAAFLWIYIEDVLATSGSYTVDVSAGVDDESGTLTTDGITAFVISPTTADDLVRDDVSAAFDAAGIVEAGNHFGVDVAKTNENATDDYRFHGVEVVVLVV